jgi:hypothetical protein
MAPLVLHVDASRLRSANEVKLRGSASEAYRMGAARTRYRKMPGFVFSIWQHAAAQLERSANERQSTHD